MKEANEKTTKQLDEKELEQVTGGAGNNQTNPATPDAQGDGEKKITRSAKSRKKNGVTYPGDGEKKITGSAYLPSTRWD